MRLVTVFLLLAGAGIIAWLVLARPKAGSQAPKAQALAVSKHSEAFNLEFEGLLGIYTRVQEDFVNWDSAAVRNRADSFANRLNTFDLDEMKKDTALHLTAQGLLEAAAGEAQTIAEETAIRPQREAFNRLTDNLLQLINTVKYDRRKLYLQECTMAYADGGTGQWLSASDEAEQRRNPYLGLRDPQYGKGMLHCGETKQTIDHGGGK